MSLNVIDDDAVIEWLLDGDPAIRWQVMRDLLDARPGEWESERARTAETGWVAQLLGCQVDAGEMLDRLALEAAVIGRVWPTRPAMSSPSPSHTSPFLGTGTTRRCAASTTRGESRWNTCECFASARRAA